MKKEDKRGLSTVIATLLTILLVIVAVGIVWAVISNIITTNSDQISLSKFTIDLEIVSVNQTTENVNIKVKRNAGPGNLEGILFSIFDGNNSHTYEKRNITLNELEMKTFVVDYQGNIVSISIYPFIKSDSGKIILGDLLDVYYAPQNSIGGGGNDGDGGTGGDDEPPACIPDCEDVICGESLNDCGTCPDTCEEGSYCNGGVCSTACIPALDPSFYAICGDAQCGTAQNGTCGNVSCGNCDEGWYCNDGVCSETCIPSLDPSQEGVCGDFECGSAQNGTCGEIGCGECDQDIGEWCEGNMCVFETILNTGTVYSVWPIGVGIYFDSPDLPTSEYTDYTNYWVKFPQNLEEPDCLQIERYVVPVLPNVYNMSYIKLLTASSNMEAEDYYEIWISYGGCTHQI